MGKIKVYVADDHTLFRYAFVKLLREIKVVETVREASNGKELLDLLAIEIPDVVIVDLAMPVMGGMKVCQKLAEAYPEVKVIVLSMHDNTISVRQALSCGADAFLTKLARPEEFEAALLAVMDGRPYTNVLMKAASQLPDKVDKNASHDPKPEFSDREKSIIDLLCKQLTNRQIAAELKLSTHTIRNHKVRIMRKAGVLNLQGLVRYAVENGLTSR